MLYLQYNTPLECKLRNPGGTFDSLYDNSWFDDTIVIEMIKDVDGVRHIFDDIFEHEVFGKFLATKLSGGVKTLILAYFGVLTEKAYPLSWLGDNCYRWLKTISDKRDVLWDGDCMVPPHCQYVDFIVKDTGERLISEQDYMWSYVRNRDFNYE